MKKRIAATALALLLCATALMISPHLIFHEDPECHRMECIVCRILAKKEGILACLFAAAAGFVLPDSGKKRILCLWLERLFPSSLSPVRLKVRLLN